MAKSISVDWLVKGVLSGLCGLGCFSGLCGLGCLSGLVSMEFFNPLGVLECSNGPVVIGVPRAWVVFNASM